MSVSSPETGRLQPEEETAAAASYHHHHHEHQCYENHDNKNSCVNEIEEEEEEEEGVEELDSVEMRHGRGGRLHLSEVGEDCVYVGVGKSESSMDALSWTLKNAVATDTTVVYLIHVFPEIHHVPSPLGKLPKSQVSPEQLENYLAQESAKRREFLEKFLSLCSSSKVKAETILIESDMVGKAILDLIPILNMRKLVLGTAKSNLRKLKSRKGSGVADQILQGAPEFCEIKIICEGKEVIEKVVGVGLQSTNGHDEIVKSTQIQPHSPSPNDSFGCMCFKPPRVL